MNDFQFSFYFKPKNLIHVTKEVVEKYKHASDIPDYLVKRNLPDLLREINALAESYDELIAYADKLRKLHLNILSSEYPYDYDDESLLRKVQVILAYRYNQYIGKQFWNHFQNKPEDSFVHSMLRKAFEVESFTFLSLDERIRQHYNDIFNSEDVIWSLVKTLIDERIDIVETLPEWKIDQDSQLHDMLWRILIRKCMDNHTFIMNQNEKNLSNILKHFLYNDFKEGMDLYLSTFKLNELHDFIMNIIIDRLSDPTRTTEKWNGMSDQAIEKCKQWVIKQELQEFFEYERFEYWEKFLNVITGRRRVNDPPIFALYFEDFVVVEFGKTGNAAYFYETEGFDLTMYSKLKNGVKEDDLKNKEVPFYINKLNHSGNWKLRFDQYMRQYLRGNFNYDHKR